MSDNPPDGYERDTMLTMPDIAARLGRALIALRGATPQQQLAAALVGKVGKQTPTQNWISRRENGEVELKPSEISAIEEVLGARVGSIYQLAGLIEPETVGEISWTSARRAIENDPLLTEPLRRMLLGAYDAAMAPERPPGPVENGDEGP